MENLGNEFCSFFWKKKNVSKPLKTSAFCLGLCCCCCCWPPPFPISLSPSSDFLYSFQWNAIAEKSLYNMNLAVSKGIIYIVRTSSVAAALAVATTLPFSAFGPFCPAKKSFFLLVYITKRQKQLRLDFNPFQGSPLSLSFFPTSFSPLFLMPA